jgi:hypothetical protein
LLNQKVNLAKFRNGLTLNLLNPLDVRKNERKDCSKAEQTKRTGSVESTTKKVLTSTISSDRRDKLHQGSWPRHIRPTR